VLYQVTGLRHVTDSDSEPISSALVSDGYVKVGARSNGLGEGGFLYLVPPCNLRHPNSAIILGEGGSPP
jgi:hypothetical protein